jgi:hypothetical protein
MSGQVMRTGSAPQALAAIRDGVLNYFRQTKQKPRLAREAFAREQSGRLSASSGGYE